MAGLKRKADEISGFEADEVGSVQVSPYHANKEVSAKSAVTSDDYFKVMEGIKHVARRITEPLKGSGYKDVSTIKEFVEWTEKRLEENASKEITVSISGNTGSGKSSTINSIFSVGTIACTDKPSSSAILVPHLYCGPLTNQSDFAMVEVQFFNRQQRIRLFKAELAAFFRAGSHNRWNDDDDDTTSQRRINEIGDDIYTRDTVTDALHSLFLQHKECKTKRATREFLKSAESEADEEILKKCNEWADKVICDIAGDRESIMLQASNPQEMLKKVEMYSTGMSDHEGQANLSLWPLVRLMKVHFENPLSKTGVKILDAPGYSDNHIRRETALELEQECSHAAIVLCAAHANNEGMVSKAVKAAKAKGQDRLVIIVTGSDDIDPETIVGGSSAERQHVAHLKMIIDELQNESDALMLQLASSVNAELFRRKLHLNICLLRAQNEEKAARIVMQRETTRTKLQEKLMDLTDSQDPIPVIFVSNLEYQKHTMGFNTLQAPILSVEQTQIPEVRRLFAQFSIEARIGGIKHFIKSNLPAAAGRVEFIGASRASDRKADMVLSIDRAARRYGPAISNAFARVLQHFDYDVLAQARNVEGEWIRHAEMFCDDCKTAYKSSPFLFLMNHNGLKRSTTNSGAVNLSGVLVNIAGGSISEIISTDTSKAIRREFQGIREDVNSLLSDICSDIKDDDSAAFVNIQPFLNHVRSERPILRDLIKNHGKGFFVGLDLIKAKSTTELEDAYLAREMLPIYAKVRAIKGGKDKIMDKPKIGWGAERHLVFKREVTAMNGVWSNACKAMEQDFKNLVETTETQMTNAVSDVFGRILSVFDKDCNSVDMEEVSQKALQALVRTCLEKADDFIKTELDPAWGHLSRVTARSQNR